MLRVYSLSSGSLHPWTFGLVFSSTPPGAAVPQALLCSMLTFCWLFALVPSHFLVLCFAQSTGGGCREGSQDCSGFPQYSNNNREVNLFVLFARAGGLWLCPVLCAFGWGGPGESPSIAVCRHYSWKGNKGSHQESSPGVDWCYCNSHPPESESRSRNCVLSKKSMERVRIVCLF